MATQGYRPTFNINFADASARFNGEPYVHTQWMSGASEDLSLAQRFVSAGTPLVLTISGLAGADLAPGSSINATYFGTLNVTAVPEPATYAPLLAGLTAVGLAARCLAA